MHCKALSPLVWYPTPSGEATQLALKDAVEALERHSAKREQIELVLRARVIGDAALEVVTKALDEEVDTAGAAVAAAEDKDEAAKAKARAELAAAEAHVKRHEEQKAAVAACGSAGGKNDASMEVKAASGFKAGDTKYGHAGEYTCRYPPPHTHTHPHRLTVLTSACVLRCVPRDSREARARRIPCWIALFWTPPCRHLQSLEYFGWWRKRGQHAEAVP